MNVTSNALVAGLIFYTTPKILTHLCTSPKLHSADSKIGQLREKMASFQKELEQTVGYERWAIMKDILVDNAWISAVAVTYFTNGNPLATLETSSLSAVTWLSTSVATSLGKRILEKKSSSTTTNMSEDWDNFVDRYNAVTALRALVNGCRLVALRVL